MKEKHMKKGISLLLCLSLVCAMLLVCSSCGSKNKIVGDWAGEIDLTDGLNKVLEDSIGDPEAMQYIKISDFTMKLTLSLEKGGDYTMAIDEKAIKKSMTDALDEMKDGMRKYFEKMIADQGLDMSVDDFFQAMAGVSFDEYLDDELDLDSILSEFEDLEESGTYKAEDGELTLKNDDGDKTEFEYELDGSTLTLDSDEDFGFGFDIFPVEMEKQ